MRYALPALLLLLSVAVGVRAQDMAATNIETISAAAIPAEAAVESPKPVAAVGEATPAAPAIETPPPQEPAPLPVVEPPPAVSEPAPTDTQSVANAIEPAEKALSVRQIRRTQKENDRLRESLVLAEAGLKDARKQLEEARKKSEIDRKDALEAAESKVEAAMKSQEEMRDELSKAIRQRSRIEVANEEMKAKTAKLQAELDQLEKVVREKDDTIKQRGRKTDDKETDELKAQREQQELVIKDLHAKYAELENDRAKTADLLAAREKQLAEDSSLIGALTGEIADLKAHRSALPDVAPAPTAPKPVEQLPAADQSQAADSAGENAALKQQVAALLDALESLKRKSATEPGAAQPPEDQAQSQKLAAQTAEIERLKAELVEAQSEDKKELKHRIKALTSADDDQRNQVAGLKREVGKTAEELAKLKIMLNERDASLAQRDEQIKKLTTDTTASDVEKRLQRQIEDKDRDIAVFRAAAEAFRAQATNDVLRVRRESELQVRQAVGVQTALDRQIADMRQSEEKNRDNLASMQKRIVELEKERYNLQSAANDKSEALAQKDRDLEKLGKELEEARNKAIADQENTLDKADKKVGSALQAQQQLKDELAEVTKQKTSLESEADELKAKVAKLQAETEQLAKAVPSTNEVAKAPAPVAAPEAGENAALKEQVAKLKEVVQALQADAAGKQSSLKEAATGLKDVQRLQLENTKLQARAAQDQATVEKQRARLLELTKTVADLKSTKQQQERTLSVTEKQQDTMKTALVQAKEDQAQSQELVAQLAENARLKAELVEAQSEQKKEMKQQIKTLASADEDQRSQTTKLTRELEKNTEAVARLKSALSEKDAVMFQRDQQIKNLTQELAARDQRIIALQAAAAVPLSAKAAPPPAPEQKKEIRATRGKMAANLVSQGRYREAESEYLYLLQLHPDDADVHYNLGVLYDDRLNDKRTAVLHYREYLRLKPNAADADRVKDWLATIQMTMGGR